MEQIKIISEPTKENPFLIIYKPSGLPSAPLSLNDENNAFYFAAKAFPQVMKVNGRKEIEHGLLHRIDNETSGLLLIAETQEFYDYLMQEQQNGRFIKYYQAVCNVNFDNAEKLKGFPSLPEPFENFQKEGICKKKICLSSLFRNYGPGQKEVRPVLLNSNDKVLKKVGKNKEYFTNIRIIENEQNIKCECKINSGYRHQVRCHLAWLGFPVQNDKIYNFNFRNDNQNENNQDKNMKFSATKLEFNYNNKDFCFEYLV